MNYFQKVYHLYSHTYSNAQYHGQAASDLVKQALVQPRPSMVCRLGSTELQTIVYHSHRTPLWLYPLRNHLQATMARKMEVLSGFFPATRSNLLKFCDLMTEDMRLADVLAVWRREENHLKKELINAKKIRLPDLEPWFHKDPWTTALEGRKVLVIHPFTESIQAQYPKRRLLFEDPRMLPDFELKTLKAVQAIAQTRTDFADWFAALDDMKQKVDRIDFDIAIIGCGAYGFPLAAHVKRLGKKALHLGGIVQVMFGIKGKRWEENFTISKLMNEHWTKPLAEETPSNFKLVDGGSYW